MVSANNRREYIRKGSLLDNVCEIFSAKNNLYFSIPIAIDKRNKKGIKSMMKQGIYHPQKILQISQKIFHFGHSMLSQYGETFYYIKIKYFLKTNSAK